MSPFPQPLSGVQILDLSLLLPGPYATMLLRSLGATVIKLEPPAGDTLEHMSPQLYRILNHGKQVERLDMKSQAGKQRLADLVAQSDALLEGFRPGTLERLGCGLDWLKSLNPKLIVTSLSGYGATGPYKDLPAHDMSVLGWAGYYALPADLHDPIARPNIRLADVLGAQTTAFAMLAALTARRDQAQVKRGDPEADGVQGTHIDTSLFEATTLPVLLALLSREQLDGKPEELGLVMADSAPYRCACGGYVCIATLEDHFWQGFVEAATDAEHPLRDPQWSRRRGRDADKHGLATLLGTLFASRSRSEWANLALAHGLPISPIQRAGELLRDPQVTSRGLIQEQRDATGVFQAVAFPAAFNGQRRPE